MVWVVDNMGCEACVDGVTKMIEKTDGVLYTSVDFESGEAEMYVAKNWKFDHNALNATLVENGYELRPRGWETQKQKFDKDGGATGGEGGERRHVEEQSVSIKELLKMIALQWQPEVFEWVLKYCCLSRTNEGLSAKVGPC